MSETTPGGAPNIKEMRARARMLRAGMSVEKATEKKGPSALVIAFGVYIGTAAALSALMAAVPGRGIPLNFPFLDAETNAALFSAAPPLSMPEEFAVTALTRAFALCLVAGILPMATLVWNRLRDNAQSNLFVSFWGTTVGLPFLYFFMKDFFGPLLVDIYTLFT